MRFSRTKMLAVLIVSLTMASGAQAERLVSRLSTETVEITSSFTGEKLTFFGNIEPDAGSEQRHVDGPYHAVIVIEGPTNKRVAREKTHQFGIWLNTDQVVFDQFPSYYQVLSSGLLGDITDPTTLANERIPPDAQAVISPEAGWWKSAVFGRELIRLMNTRGLFGVNETGVQFQSQSFYAAQLTLPSSAPPGPYLANTYIFKDGKVIARKSEGFAVRKIAFERFIATSAREQPLLYGIVCVVLAVFTGWFGGVLFKR